MSKLKKYLSKYAPLLGAFAVWSAAVLPACTSNDLGFASKYKNHQFISKIIDNKYSQIASDQKESKMIVISDHGKKDDKSFNQSALEGLIKTGVELKLNSLASDFLEPNGVNYTNFSAQYKIALIHKIKYWILPGFLHGDNIKRFWSENRQKMIDNKTVIIGIDFDPTAPTTFGDKTYTIDPGYAIGINFDVKEAAFSVGYATAKYLSTRFTNKSQRILNTFGGGQFPGVTDFIFGFIAGAHAWNLTNEQSSRVQFKSNQITLDSGFNLTDPKMIGAVTNVTQNDNKIILPVAGPATGLVLDDLAKKTNSDQLVIGVDVDQSKSYNNPQYFFSSILKNIGQATYDVLGSLYTGKKEDLLKGFNLGSTSINLFKGVDANFVGSATSTIGNLTNRKEAQDSLTEATSWFKTNKTKLAKYYFNAYKDVKSYADFFKSMIDDVNKLSSQSTAKTEVSNLDSQTAPFDTTKKAKS